MTTMDNIIFKSIIFFLQSNNDSPFFLFLKNGSSVLVFMGLYFIMFLLNKILWWSSPEAQFAGKKLRFLLWGFIISFTTWWFVLDLPFTTLPDLQAPLVKGTWSLMIFFSSLLAFDILNIMFFDVYYPRTYGTRIPQIISNLIRGIYFIIIVLSILAMIYQINVKPFLTGSAILTAIIGLAMQDTLGNLFSGLALHMSRPFDIGHWIKTGDMEGDVVRIEWRATTIQTRERDYISIPNSHLSRLEVINFSTPTTIHGISVEVGVGYTYPPKMIKRLLNQAALSTEGVIHDIRPDIFLVKYNDFSVDYRMRFFINDYSKAPIIKTAVMEKIWYVFNRNDVVIPFPIRDVYMKKEKPLFTEEEMLSILGKIDFLQDLDKEGLMDVASRLKLMLYFAGEVILRQGDTGDTFYILKSGTVEVSATNEKGEMFLKKNLDSGTFFGEISVLTGEPRTATIEAVTDVELLMLNKADFEHLLNTYSNMDEKISQKIVFRQKFDIEQKERAKISSEKEAEEKTKKKLDSLSQQLLNKIRNFFRIR